MQLFGTEVNNVKRAQTQQEKERKIMQQQRIEKNDISKNGIKLHNRQKEK